MAWRFTASALTLASAGLLYACGKPAETPASLASTPAQTGVDAADILGTTDKRAPAGLAPIAIGLCLTLIHLISIPVTNTSVNPARSTGVAIYVGDWAVAQLWLFWVAPIVGALLGALAYRSIASKEA